MKKVVINSCFGGFGLSPDAILKYAKLSGFKIYPYAIERTEFGNLNFDKYKRLSKEELKEQHMWIIWIKNDLGEIVDSDILNKGEYFCDRDIKRDDPNLIKVVESLKKKANTRFSDLRVVEIPEDIQFEIQEYDGNETIAAKHRTWN